MKIFSKILLAALFLLSASVSFSIPSKPPPPPGGGGASCWPPPCTPIDNGIIFLIAIAALYAGKKLYDFQKRAKA